MKKIVALFLTLVMVFSLGMVSYAADQSEDPLIYTALGDSASNGYGMAEYGSTTYVYGHKVATAYPAKFAAAIEADVFNQDCLSGLRSEDLRYLLEPENYSGDAYSHRVAFGDYVMGSIRDVDGIQSFEQLSSLYIQHVTEADVITLNIGLNNFGNFIMTQLQWLIEDNGVPRLQYSLDSEMEAMLNTAEVQAFKEAVYSFLSNITVTEGMTAATLVQMAETVTGWIVYSYVDNLRCFDAIVNRIYELNPDVELYVIGMYDPLGDICLADGKLNIGAMMTMLTGTINTHSKCLAPHCYEYTYVDVMDTEIFGISQNITDENFVVSLSADNGKNIHPSYAGHEYIFNQLMDKYEVPFKDISHSSDCYDAVRSVYRSGLMTGVTDTLFMPLNGITRAEIANSLYILAGSPDVSGMSEPFIDVTADTGYYNAILWAYNTGIIPGATSKLFSPGVVVNRSTMASILYSYAGSPAVDTISFKDKALIKSANRAAASWCVTASIMESKNNYFNPGLMVTRADFAEILCTLTK